MRGSGPLQVCAVPDGAKLPNHGPVPLLSPTVDPGKHGVRLEAARDEVVAFQLILRGDTSNPVRVEVSSVDLVEAGGSVIGSQFVQFFLAHHVRVDPGGYTWGPPTQVLEWPDFYPDALVPFAGTCGARSTLVPTVEVPAPGGGHQLVWVDVHVPRDQAPGTYRGSVRVSHRGNTLSLPLEVRVSNATLPSAPTLDAVAELYDAYAREGVGTDPEAPGWAGMARCYQQLAHAHRAVFIERAARAPATWESYDRAHGPALDGTLFTASHGYSGPGEGTPVSTWRTPWPQIYNGRLDAPLSDEQLAQYERLAGDWDHRVEERGWARTRYFAYLFDEVDGPTDEGAAPSSSSHDEYVVMAHRQMARVQQALDRGARRHAIDLIWTSHSNPAQWAGRAGLDLAGTIRLWCPNAQAAPPEYLAERIAHGERAWFYHAGHPSVGAHSINVPGFEMRTWGVIAARYGLTGFLLWAANLSDADDPFRSPSYKAGDDRFGNGTLVYPGNRLPKIGLPATPGPIPSVRLKMLRRGIQDADLAALARRAGRGAEIDRLLRETVPAALADAHGRPTWPSNLAAWDSFHSRLLALAQP